MTSRRLARVALASAVVVVVLSLAGFVVSLVLNAFFLDEYDAYGEVSVPGSSSLQLPAGEVTVSLHTVVIGGPNGGGLPVPPLGITIDPPDGVAQPVVTESIGSTTTVNNDAHVRVWVVQIPAAGTYHVRTDGQVGGYINPRLAFGHKSSYGYLVWVFIACFVVGLVGLAASVAWLFRTRKKAVAARVPTAPHLPHDRPVVTSPATAAVEPTGEGVRLERLKTLAALRDSGALTEAEFETEKRRILEGH